MSTRYILSIDPGLATGLSFFSIESGEDPVLLFSWEADFAETQKIVRGLYEKYPTVETVCERFTITVATAKKSQAPFSLEVIGMVKGLMLDAGYDPQRLALQMPSDAKNIFPNPKLKKLGYWHVGEGGHANDSIRHGLLYLVKTGWKPVGLLE